MNFKVVLKVDVTFYSVFTAVDVCRLICTPHLSNFIAREMLVTLAHAFVFKI